MGLGVGLVALSPASCLSCSGALASICVCHRFLSAGNPAVALLSDAIAEGNPERLKNKAI